ncbi:hypothetical protein ACPCTO_16715 [Streptomyces olivoreticuli]
MTTERAAVFELLRARGVTAAALARASHMAETAPRGPVSVSLTTGDFDIEGLLGPGKALA